ncbi:alpha/beta hydrolase [Spongiimicrobium salis]|uniref:alpha/beta hydrolase n=1 Tax=Spongiimicrobium salis TaxID=1667022 RepID=UPI00374DC147
MRRALVLFISLFSLSLSSQEEVSVLSNDLTLYGTLLTPTEKTEKAILIISGSGETDRNGNTLPLNYTNNSLKQLAKALTNQGYATLRYDKRGVGKSKNSSLSPEKLRYEHYIRDAEKWIAFLKKKYAKVIIIGHSQGGLTGMSAMQQVQADGLISLAGITEDVYTTLKRQLAAQPQFVKDTAFPILDSLNIGVKTDSVPQYLHAFLHPKIQDYMMSFMAYDPRVQIKKIAAPILIIQGTTDLQITVEGAQSLAASQPSAAIEIITGMNHVLKESTENQIENLGTYSNPDLPLHPELIPKLLSFLDTW